jgi:hypothetical protein
VYKNLSFVILMMMFSGLQAQQSSTLFFMHFLPESNFVNPAVQIECKLFIGLPLMSSIHMHASNSGFTAGQLLQKKSGGGYSINDNSVLKSLGSRNLLTTELQTTILAVGLRRDDYYYTFTIQEKDNLALIYTRDMMAFALKGNTQFEGQWIDFRGTGIFFSHLREYALGVSKVKNNDLTVGVRAKLLFGKLNLTTGRSNIGLYTQANTLDLLFNLDAGFKSSLPYSLGLDDQGNYRFYSRYHSSVSNYLLNRRNPGIAIDMGFIYKYSDRLTLSGSLLDLGMIYYRSNLTQYKVKGDFLYQGPLADSAVSEHYLWDVFDAINANMSVDHGYKSYVFFLDPRLYLGATYKLSKNYNVNLLLYNRFFPTKIQTEATVSITNRPVKNWEASISWSYMNRSVANLGFGLGYGRSPVQFYLVSDNILGFILPMNTKNVNLRFGLNLIFGCRKELNLDQCGCAWLRDSERRRLRNEGLSRGKKNKGN